MFTQCPQCDAVFQLSASQLRAANGDVRCGQCLSVFNALNHLSEDIPPAQQEADTTENLAHEADAYHDWPEEITDSVTNNVDESVAGPASTGQMDTDVDNIDDVFSDIISEVKGHDISVEEIDRFEEFLATDTLPAEDPLTTGDTFPVEHSPSTDSSPLTEDTLFSEDSIPEPDSITDTDFTGALPADKTSVSADETSFGDTATATLDTDINFDDDEFAEFDAYLDVNGPENISANNTAQHSDKMNADNDTIIVETTDFESLTSPVQTDTPDVAPEQQSDADIMVPEENPQAETASAAEAHLSSANETQTVNIPSLILDDLHAARAEQLRPSGTPWMIGSLLLMFTLILQVVYHSRDELARDASLRPWLIQVCEMLNCTLSQPYDIKQIEIIGRDVRSHPSVDKALIVSTTLINNATFVQPFPLLTMVFSDINGTKIAQRRFTPREYLSNTVDLATGMTPDMPVRIDLELVDPGKAAVNYEFYAEIDPRQTRPLT